MANIYLVRHGQAAAGFGSHADPGLDDTGRAQADAVAQMLAPLGPLPIISSTMARAFETAQPLAALWQQQITLEARIAEIPSPVTDLAARAAWLSQAMQGNWSDLQPATRAWRDALHQCLLAVREDCVMFSHYVAINAAVGCATGDDRMRIFAPDNCSVTTLVLADGKLGVHELGRTADTHIN